MTGRTAARVLAAFAVSWLIAAAPPAAAQDPLPSWNDTAPKKAIVAFVAKVTKAGTPDFVPPNQRIATFDNDGTLWAEQPMYFQFEFAVDRIKLLSAGHPEWKTQEPYASLMEGDFKRALARGEQDVVDALAATHAGMTTESFERIAREWIRTKRDARFKRPYITLVYQPMLELLAYLRANGFKTFIVTGGGIEFVRAFAEDAYGIPPDQVVGSSGRLKYQMRGDVPELLKLPAVDFVNDKEGKVVGIQKFIGRRPIAAFGNSDGDLQMLEWTAAGKGPRLALLVHHTDAAREWAYDRGSHVGALDKALDVALAKKWTVVSMKDDWNAIFPKQ
ncbi:MAG TPA: HAD family hydrolase [Steroidobacteraceae bacterium]|nr:HAD family hydrolase [Steroidobacteraceae bacterium]